MGDFRVRPIKDRGDRYRMYQYALEDIEVFEEMCQGDLMDEEIIHIGAEQELCIVDQCNTPSKEALSLLDRINDPHYTNELGLYNLEINLDPERLEKTCFSDVERKLIDLLTLGKEQAALINERIVLAGILPTLNVKHLDFDYMTPIPRYKTLSKMLYDIRGGKFEIYLQGVDDLMASLGSVLFEACNTSFQLHLQIKPHEFVDRFNWSQMIAAPVLAASVNSPLLLGRELWAESRIALFKQSLDTRSSKNHLRKKLPRVYFGNDWLTGSPANLWRNELMRFPLILTSDDLKDARHMLDHGETPDLRAIRLHNGTTYTWNRLCYGSQGKPHIRIECRYLPAGPSVIDEIANFAFWVGLMYAMPSDWNEQKDKIYFKSVKGNFIRSARNGLNSVLSWYGKNIPAKKLILTTLLPMAKRGLTHCNVEERDIAKYLGVIERRVQSEQTGAAWMISQYRALLDKNNSHYARKQLVSCMLNYQEANLPVHQWDIKGQMIGVGQDTDDEDVVTVGEIMTTDIYAVNEDASLSLVTNIMKWKEIHHLPIENYDGDLVGIITDGLMRKSIESGSGARYASDIMKKDVISVDRDTSITELRSLLAGHQLKGVPVTRQGQLIGMVTTNDLTD